PAPLPPAAGPGRPPPPGSPPAPGTYAAPTAFRLEPDPVPVAAALAEALHRAGWVHSAGVTSGYVTVTVTADALARLAVRITTAGPAGARSTALAGTASPAPPAPDLTAAAGWADARRQPAASLPRGRAGGAGAHPPPPDPADRGPTPPPRPTPAPGSGAAAVEFAGAGAVRYALARLPPGTPARVDPCQAAARPLGVPAYA